MRDFFLVDSRVAIIALGLFRKIRNDVDKTCVYVFPFVYSCKIYGCFYFLPVYTCIKTKSNLPPSTSTNIHLSLSWFVWDKQNIWKRWWSTNKGLFFCTVEGVERGKWTKSHFTILFQIYSLRYYLQRFSVLEKQYDEKLSGFYWMHLCHNISHFCCQSICYFFLQLFSVSSCLTT